MLPFLRMHWQGKKLAWKLRRSLINAAGDPQTNWVVRERNMAPLCVEYVEGGDRNKVRFSIAIVPGTGSCVCRCCDQVIVRVDGATVWVPPLASRILGNAVRAFALDHANRVANRVL